MFGSSFNAIEITQTMVDDALRFMRVPREGRDTELQDAVRRTFDELEKIIQPRAVWGRWSVNALTSDNNITGICVAGFEILSSDLAKVMADSHECYLMAVTIGPEVDRKILLAQTRGMLEGMMLDACASVRADVLCDQAEREIIASLAENESLTPRFSPGYGDAPLAASQDIIAALDATRRIGLSMTRSFMMTPVKSITALIGVLGHSRVGRMAETDNCKRPTSCELCHAREGCPYRMRGEHCGKRK